MVCEKCGFGHMISDNHGDVQVYKCWVCGNRTYTDHPRRAGGLVCSRCGCDMDERNQLGWCKECIKLLNIHVHRAKRRTYDKGPLGRP
jgi:hypothetical protein